MSLAVMFVLMLIVSVITNLLLVKEINEKENRLEKEIKLNNRLMEIIETNK